MGEWLKALTAQHLEVQSARDALTVKGWLDSGNYALNWAMSGRLQRGYPLGHTVEIFGDPSTGKSFLIARALGMAQVAGGVALLDDTEHAYNREWMERLGINVGELGYCSSRTVKQHLTATEAFIAAFRTLKKAPPLGVLACDSLAQLSTEHELEVQLDKPDMSKAKELRAFFRIMGGELARLPVVHISTNHTIANIGNQFVQRTTPGGGGPKYQASIRLDLRMVSKIKTEVEGAREYIGVQAHVVVDKNRITAPWKEVRLGIPFYQPLSRASGLIPLLQAWGLLTTRGQFLFFREKKVGRAYNNKKHILKQDEQAEQLLDLVPDLLEECDQRLADGSLQTVPGVSQTEEGDDDE